MKRFHVFHEMLETFPIYSARLVFKTTAQDATCDASTFRASKSSESLVAQSERLASNVGGRLNVLPCERDEHGDRCWRPPPHFSCPPPLPTLPSLPAPLPPSLTHSSSPCHLPERLQSFSLRPGCSDVGCRDTGGSDACGWPMRLTASSIDLE